MESSILIPFIVSLALMTPAFVLVFIPMFPTLPYVFVVALLFAIVTKFQILTSGELLWLAVPLVFGALVDYLAGVLGAKYGGASRRSIFAGIGGILLGTLLIPPFGGIIGLCIAVFISEMIQFGDRKKAFTAMRASFIGTILGLFVNFLILVIFIGLYLIFIL